LNIFGGGGVYCEDSNAVFDHCTISGNFGGYFGAGFYSVESDNFVRNSILWDNFPYDIGFPLLGGSLLPLMTYSDFDGFLFGQGNLSEYPMFAAPGYWADPNYPEMSSNPDDPHAVWVDGDYRLLWLSPCIDKGDPNDVPYKDQRDIEGDSRVYNGRTDMGCDEYVPIANFMARCGETYITLLPDTNAPNPDQTYFGHTTITFDSNFKMGLNAIATPVSTLGGTWAAWIYPDTIGPGMNLEVELWVYGEDVDVSLLPPDVDEVVLVEIQIVAALVR
jgi:hypothetical protein